VPRNFTHNWEQLGKSLIHSDKALVMAGTTSSLSGQPAPHHESLHSLRNHLYRIDYWCFWVLLWSSGFWIPSVQRGWNWSFMEMGRDFMRALSL
jgi:hypothetical protein